MQGCHLRYHLALPRQAGSETMAQQHPPQRGAQLEPRAEEEPARAGMGEGCVPGQAHMMLRAEGSDWHCHSCNRKTGDGTGSAEPFVSPPTR